MKKLISLGFLGSAITSFFAPVQVLAVDASPTNIIIATPSQGFTTLGNAIGNIITVAFAIAVILVLVMLIWGAFEWISSGGDKESVAKARGRIINALIGLAVLAVAFALAKFAGQFTNINIFNLAVPTPNTAATGI
ncbi:hypothetical protein M1437_00490 [Patescibacteria group bacterium]|nr:hypothetical protein [Patescibacteria group bacterium]